jgi:integrase
MGERGRPSTGQVRRHARADGLTSYSLRVRAYGQRHTVRLGTELDGWTEPRAEMELANIYAQIRAGIWQPPRPRQTDAKPEPTFHEYASLWLRRRIAEGIAENTRKDYLWQLSSHLLPFFGAYQLSDITPQVVEAFKETKLDERARVTAAAEFGEPLRDRNGRPRRALSNTSLNKFLVLLNAILETAVRRDWLPDNPAARVERLRTRRRKGAILEADELESLIDAAAPADRRSPHTAERRRRVRELRDHDGLSWREIAEQLGIASSTAVYLYRQPERSRSHEDDGRRALVATLGCGGLRATEAADLDVGDIDLAHRKLHVRDSKTEAGIRDVDLTPRLADELARYLNTRNDSRPDQPAFPTRTGARRDKDNIRQRVIAPALRKANRERCAAGLPPITVHVTPHTLRRTYISLMLAAGADVPYVQAQVGHTDPKMTLEIYALVLKRRDRSQFAEAFDILMRDAIPSMRQAKMATDGQHQTAWTSTQRPEITV